MLSFNLHNSRKGNNHQNPCFKVGKVESRREKQLAQYTKDQSDWLVSHTWSSVSESLNVF